MEPFNVSINPSEDDVNSGDTVAPVQNLPLLSRIANNVRNMIPFVNIPPPPRDETIPNISANSKLKTKSFQTFVRSLCRTDL